MRASKWIMLVLPLLGFRCGPDPRKSFDPNYIVCAHDDQMSQKDLDTLQAISEVVAEESTCLDITDEKSDWPENSVGNCAVEEVEFEKKAPHEWSKGQRILIVDDGMHRAAFTRYKKRVLDFLEYDETGTLDTTQKPIRMHRGERLVLSEILGEQNPYMPARKLNDSRGGRELKQKFPSMESVGHGSIILGILAEHNPQAEFVIAQLPPHFTGLYPEHFCRPSEQSLKEIEAHFKSASDKLIEVIRQNEISFIQYAENVVGEDTFPSYYQRDCNDAPTPNLSEWFRSVQRAQFEFFVKPLGSIPGVILVQAGPRPNYKVEAGDEKYLMDCSPLPNRLRVGFLNVLSSQLPIEGANDFDLLWSSQNNARECIDLFVNGGAVGGNSRERKWKAAPYAIKFACDGMIEIPYMELSTSWASPVGLSYLIYLKKSLPPETTVQELLHHANNGGKGKMKDPAFFAQFEKCRFNQSGQGR
jgi:hypothetical protein